MTLIKICGLTTLEDVGAAVDLGVDYLGFIFHEKSPRNLSFAQATEVTRLLRGYDAPRIPQCVAVFVNPTVDQVVSTLQRTGFQIAQIHRADPARLRELRIALQSVMYASISPRTLDEVDPFLALEDDVELMPTAFWLPQLHLDAYHPTLAGGTGHVADWTLAAAINQRVPRLMLAGGLTPANVAEAIARVQPFAVDVSSGVETLPGIKSHRLLRHFVEAVRQADPIS